MVRLEGPVQGLQRYTTRDVTLHGVTIPKGTVINVNPCAACPTSTCAASKAATPDEPF